MTCGFTQKVIDGFYEHHGNEFIDHNVVEGCPQWMNLFAK